MAGRGMGLPPRQALHSEADPHEWGDALLTYVDERAKLSRAKSEQNEVRWGDVLRVPVPIPASGIDQTIEIPARQFVNITQPARVWAIAYQLAWSDIAAGIAGDTVSALFDSQIGVGSSKIDLLDGLTLTAPNPFGAVNLIRPAFPAATIYITVAISILAKASAARSMFLLLNAQAAPVFR